MKHYRLICQRRGADAETRSMDFDTVHEARNGFDHMVALAVQHGEWSRLQVLPLHRGVNVGPWPIMAYDSAGLAIETIRMD